MRRLRIMEIMFCLLSFFLLFGCVGKNVPVVDAPRVPESVAPPTADIPALPPVSSTNDEPFVIVDVQEYEVLGSDGSTIYVAAVHMKEYGVHNIRFLLLNDFIVPAHADHSLVIEGDERCLGQDNTQAAVLYVFLKKLAARLSQSYPVYSDQMCTGGALSYLDVTEVRAGPQPVMRSTTLSSN